MNKGSITIWVLVFGTVFIIMLTGLLGYLIFQIKDIKKTEARNSGFHIAEAGLNFARWRLAHSPEDIGFSGVYDYRDPEGAILGKFELELDSGTDCGPGIKIISSGWKDNFEGEKRVLKIIYAKPSLASFSFLTNSNAWFGPEENLKGPFHSNGGIRMDGSQNSLSTSAREKYVCGAEHGCSSSNCFNPCVWKSGVGCECPGIWGEGEGGSQSLWEYPSSNIDFEKIIQDLAKLKEEAQAEGIYLSQPTRQGFHLKFKSDSTIDVYSVQNLREKVWGYDGEKWVHESNSIEKESFFANYVLPSNCAPIFAENDVWIDGVVNGRATVVAARLPDVSQNNAKIIIPDNIIYLNSNSSLGIISQSDILVPLYSPSNLEIDAVMLAQKGHVFRYYYPLWNWEPYRTYAKRDYLKTFGSIISYTMWTFSWVSGVGGPVVSGYETTDMRYDPNLTFNPPPMFPTTGDYEIVSWEEID